jgi:hypothetical protein
VWTAFLPAIGLVLTVRANLLTEFKSYLVLTIISHDAPFRPEVANKFARKICGGVLDPTANKPEYMTPYMPDIKSCI